MKSTKYSQQQFCGWFLRKATKVKVYSRDSFIDIRTIENLFRDKKSALYLFHISHIGTHLHVIKDVSPECLYRNRYDTSEFYTIDFQYGEKWQQYEITATRYSADEFLKLSY